MLMKKNTLLTMLLALFGVVAFAQKDIRTPLESAQSPSTPFKCIDRHSMAGTKSTASVDKEKVTPPSTAQVE